MSETVTMEGSHKSMHGQLGHKDWQAPQCVMEFDSNARYSFTPIKAHEFRDREDVLQAKISLLADLVRRSKNCLAFTGAGISTAAGIDDYATKGRDESVTAEGRPEVKDWKEARPTRAHRVMAAMHEAGLLRHWVQQNHDSLPQKAGYPQHALNEIHGSLHDPANPIVPYEGSLRDDLFEWLQQWELQNDLCLALGTSLSGFNVDSMAETAGQRFRQGKSSGLVLVNLQQTPYDGLCSLRIFAKIDEVMEGLARELGIAEKVRPMDHVHVPNVDPGSCIGDDVFQVPFDEEGNPSPGGKMVWDLRVGQHVKLTGGPYEGDVGRITEKSAAGHYRIRFQDSVNPTFNVKRRPFSLWLGNWWVEETTKGYGIVPGGRLPFVNAPEPVRVEAAAPVRTGPVVKPKLTKAPPPLPPGKGKGKGKGKEKSKGKESGEGGASQAASPAAAAGEPVRDA